MCFQKIFWPLEVKKVKSEVAPYCKLTFVMKTNYVPSFMHAFIQMVFFKGLALSLFIPAR